MYRQLPLPLEPASLVHPYRENPVTAAGRQIDQRYYEYSHHTGQRWFWSLITNRYMIPLAHARSQFRKLTVTRKRDGIAFTFTRTGDDGSAEVAFVTLPYDDLDPNRIRRAFRLKELAWRKSKYST